MTEEELKALADDETRNLTENEIKALIPLVQAAWDKNEMLKGNLLLVWLKLTRAERQEIRHNYEFEKEV